MPLIGVTRHGVCRSGPWGDIQVLQGDKTMATWEVAKHLDDTERGAKGPHKTTWRQNMRVVPILERSIILLPRENNTLLII